MKKILSFYFVLIILFNCKSTNINQSKKLKFDNSNDSINLYAFVGEKISVIETATFENRKKTIYDEETGDSITVEYFVMDNEFKCKYKVLKNVFNQIKNDTVEFLAYDHYGRPGFENQDTVLLYLSRNTEEKNFYHQKYQFDKVFLDRRNGYYTYPRFRGKKYYAYKDSLIGFDIELKSEKFNFRRLNNKSKIDNKYPSEFYHKDFEDSIAYPIKGIYLNEMINYRLKTTFNYLIN